VSALMVRDLRLSTVELGGLQMSKVKVYRKTAATKTNLPVIPKSVGDLIENYCKDESLSNLLFDATTFHFEDGGLD